MKARKLIALTCVFWALETPVGAQSCGVSESGDVYTVFVGEDEAYVLGTDDMTVLRDGNKTLVKIGPGCLYSTSDIVDWTGATILSNGYCEVDSHGALGSADGALTIENGASLVVATPAGTYSALQQKFVRVKGLGFNGGSAIINRRGGGSKALGNIMFDADSTIGPGVGFCYYTCELSGHTVRIVAENPFTFSNPSTAVMFMLETVQGPGKFIVSSGATLQVGNGCKFSSQAEIELTDGATLSFENMVGTNCQSPVYVDGSATLYSWWAEGGRNNDWQGPVIIRRGRLDVTFGAVETPCVLARGVKGAGKLRIAGGTLTLGAADGPLMGLELAEDGKLVLPADGVLTVQRLEVDGVSYPEGSYGAGDIASILSGSVKVDPKAIVVEDNAQAAEYAIGLKSTGVSSCKLSADGRVDLVCEGGEATVPVFLTGVSNLLKQAYVRFDASDTYGSVLLQEGETDSEGHPCFYCWCNANVDGPASAKADTSIGSPFAYCWEIGTSGKTVSTSTSLRAFSCGGITRTWAYFGAFSTAQGGGNTGPAVEPTASAMHIWGSPKMSEIHVVHADTRVGAAYGTSRNVILGRDKVSASPEYVPGNRGSNGSLFSQNKGETEAFRDGGVWVDNKVSDSAYVPAVDDVHVYSFVPTTPQYRQFNTIAADCGWYYGGERIGEIILYWDANAEVDRARIDAFLLKKWKGIGVGETVSLGSLSVSGGATVSFTNATEDTGCTLVAEMLGGGGRIMVPAQTTLCVSNLAFSVRSRQSVDRLAVGGAFSLAPAGTLRIDSQVEVNLASGSYTLLDAGTNDLEGAFSDWTVQLPPDMQRHCVAKVTSQGGKLLLELVRDGMLLIVR